MQEKLRAAGVCGWIWAAGVVGAGGGGEGRDWGAWWGGQGSAGVRGIPRASLTRAAPAPRVAAHRSPGTRPPGCAPRPTRRRSGTPRPGPRPGGSPDGGGGGEGGGAGPGGRGLGRGRGGRGLDKVAWGEGGGVLRRIFRFWGREGASPAASWSPSSAPRSVPPGAAPRRSWDAPWGPTEGGWSIPMSPSVPSALGHNLANLHPPEHHLDGRFRPLGALLQAPRRVPVAARRVNLSCAQRASGLPESPLTHRGIPAPPCPALLTELALLPSRSFPSPPPSLLHTGTGCAHLRPPPQPPFPGSHPSGKARPALPGALVKDLPGLAAAVESLSKRGTPSRGVLESEDPWLLPSRNRRGHPDRPPLCTDGDAEAGMGRPHGRAWTRLFLLYPHTPPGL